MVLSDIEIRAEINAKRLVFDPPITDINRIGSSSVDLLLHEELIILPAGPVSGITMVPSDDQVDVMSLLKKHGEDKILSEPDATHRMEPHRFLIGKTLEVVELPSHLAARIEGKSSLARLGLAVHVTAPTVLAGFNGRLYLEMYNVGPFPIELKAGMKIAQLILEHVGLPPLTEYQGQFQAQE